MSTKTQNQTFKSFEVVDFLDIDTSKITLSNPKPNNYGGSYAALRYDGKTLYVRYDARICPFGISSNTNKKGEVTGYSTSISLKKNDPYFIKAREIDDFFIERCIDNSVLWGLGGSKTEKVDLSSIVGYDDKGDKGKWKRILKYAYKIDKITNERVYKDYPPRMEFSVPDDKMKCRFFDDDGNPSLTFNIPNWSHISVLALWGSVALGTWGASIKPKAQQIRVFTNNSLDFDNCLLDEDDDEDEDDLIPLAI